MPRNRLTAFPLGGSAMVLWDTGIPAPPITNTPLRALTT